MNKLEYKSVDFTIEQVPSGIYFICPYCEEDVWFDWDEIEKPDYWGDDWGNIQCPHCGLMTHLDDYELD